MSAQPLPVELRIDPVDLHDHRAMKAMQRGDATAEQQAIVLKLIVKNFAATHDLQYVPGNPSAGDFLSGRAFVGQQILKLLNTPVPDDKPKVK